MPIKLSDLIAKVPGDVEQKVKRVRDQTRPAIQEALRSECRLVMRTPEESDENRVGAQVPVEVAPGHPAALTRVEFPDDLGLILLLGRYRSSLEDVHNGTRALLDLRRLLATRSDAVERLTAVQSELQAAHDWTGELLKQLNEHDPLKTVLKVEEDILGVYEFNVRNQYADENDVNRAGIRIYWGVVGLVAGWMGCSVEDLTIVVLTHELAHAYTQLGADIEGRRWIARNFAQAETSLTEGLAQYYTERVLRRLERRHGGAIGVFENLLAFQPAAYRTQESWTDNFSPESVRRALLEVRQTANCTLLYFTARLDEAEKALRPEKYSS